MWIETNYSVNEVKEICHNCGSPAAKRSYNYFRRIHYVSKGKVWSKVWSKDGIPVAFFYALRSKDHVRLIEIAVKQDYQRQGIGERLLSRLLSTMKQEELYTLTFRTPIGEEAQFFWLKMGAKVTDVKGDDYEMELNIKK